MTRVPEISLWRSVVQMAFLDAFGKTSKRKTDQSAYDRRIAVTFLTSGSRWFYEVCLMADLSPTAVKRRAHEYLHSGDTFLGFGGQGVSF